MPVSTLINLAVKETMPTFFMQSTENLFHFMQFSSGDFDCVWWVDLDSTHTRRVSVKGVFLTTTAVTTPV
jgi:hypothetical protein